MLTWISDPQAWLALVTLTALEVVLGIDNIIFISILAGKLPENQRDRARKIGLAIAMLTRIGLLFSLAWIMKLTQPLFHLFSQGISGRDLILIFGGLFLIAKATTEIHSNMEPHEHHGPKRLATTFAGVILQITLMDIIFSLDSVITAIGMADQIQVMVLAIIIAVIFMIMSVGTINDFIDRNPTFKILALSFLVLVGVALLGEGLGMHIPKGYIYFAMAYAVGVEMIHMKIRSYKSTVSPQNTAP